MLFKVGTLFTLCLFTLFSCQTIDVEQLQKTSCQSTNWAEQGRTDALNGEKYNEDLINRCKQLTGSDHTSEYKKSYSLGLEKLCTPDYAVYFGRQGKVYQNTCPEKLENAFLAKYSQGKLEYDKFQIEKQNAKNIETLATKPSAPPAGLFQYPFPPQKSCFSSFDCEIKDKCIQDPKSSFSADRICQNRPDIECFSDWDCEIKGRCEDRNCKYKLK